MTVDARDYLIKLGLAKPTRGRFSREAIAALDEARRNGTVFLDKKTATMTATPVSAENGHAVPAAPVVRESNPYAQHHAPLRTGTLLFVKGKTKQKISATNACHACSYSFGWCKCSIPTFLYWKTGEVLSYADNV